MNTLEQEPIQPITHEQNQQAYISPGIIYEGTISTRAGTPLGGNEEGVDPADLFGND